LKKKKGKIKFVVCSLEEESRRRRRIMRVGSLVFCKFILKLLLKMRKILNKLEVEKSSLLIREINKLRSIFKVMSK